MLKDHYYNNSIYLYYITSYNSNSGSKLINYELE